MNRVDLQRISERRLAAAQSLLQADHFGAAYYLAGYTIECALKACIAKQFREHDFPDKKTVTDSYTHDLEKLIKVAGLDRELDTQPDAVQVNWEIVKDWSQESRYQDRSEREARTLIFAISDPSSGVFEWIKQHW